MGMARSVCEVKIVLFIVDFKDPLKGNKVRKISIQKERCPMVYHRMYTEEQLPKFDESKRCIGS